jgi:hypothetical protein
VPIHALMELLRSANANAEHRTVCIEAYLTSNPNRAPPMVPKAARTIIRQ